MPTGYACGGIGHRDEDHDTAVFDEEICSFCAPVADKLEGCRGFGITVPTEVIGINGKPYTLCGRRCTEQGSKVGHNFKPVSMCLKYTDGLSYHGNPDTGLPYHDEVDMGINPKMMRHIGYDTLWGHDHH